MTEAGLIVICSFISPFRAERRMVRQLTGPSAFFEIFVDTPLEECIRRDPKGLYAKATAGRRIGWPSSSRRWPGHKTRPCRLEIPRTASLFPLEGQPACTLLTLCYNRYLANCDSDT